MFGQKSAGNQGAPFNVPTVCEVTSDAVNDAFQSLARQLNDIVAPPIQKNFDPETGKLLKIRCGTTGPATVECSDPTDWTSEVGNELLAASAYSAMGVSGDGLWLWGIKNVSPGSNGKIYTWALDSTTGLPISTTPTSSAASTTLRSVTDVGVTDETGTKLMCVKGSTLQFVSLVSGVPTVRGSVASPTGSPAAYAEGIWVGNRVVFCPKVANQIMWIIDASDLDNPTIEHQVVNTDSGGMTQGNKVYTNTNQDYLFVGGVSGVESWSWATKTTKPATASWLSLGTTVNTFSYDEEKQYIFQVQWTNNTTLTYKTVDIAADGFTLSLNTNATITGTFTNYGTFRESWTGYNDTYNVTAMLNIANAGGWFLVFNMNDLTAVTLHENFAVTSTVAITYAKWIQAGDMFWLWGNLGVATEVFKRATLKFIIPCQLEIGRIKFTLTDPPCDDTKVMTGIPAGHGTIDELDSDRLDGFDGPYYLDSDNFTGTEWVDLTDGLESSLHTHDHGTLNGLADDDHPQYLLRSIANGTFKQSFDALVTASGATATVTITNAASASEDLIAQFSDGLYTFDVTPGATVNLTVGTDASPQANYVYLLQSNKTLTVSTSDWPATEHAKIAYFLVPSAARVASHGCYINQNWNDHLEGTDNMGHLAHMSDRIRRTHAFYVSGLSGAGLDNWLEVNTNVGTPDNVWVKINSGVVYQMHRHTVPAFNSEAPDSDEFLVVNQFGANYTTGTDLADFLTDAAGVSMSGKYFNVVLWAVANKSGEYSPVMVNLPTGSYNTLAEAQADAESYSVFTIPSAYIRESSTGFLLARALIRHQAGSGGTWTVQRTYDLRGTDPEAAAAGGGVAIGDHGALAGLADDDHTQYALLAGRSTGQTISGGTDSQDDLELNSTAHATKGDVNIEGGLIKASRNGNYVRQYDAGLTDYVQHQHNGTNFLTSFVNTAQWVITGLLNLNGSRIIDTPTNRGLLDGLTMANTSTDSAHDIAVETGIFESSLSTRDYIYEFPSRMIKQIDASWAVGTNAGGMATGSVAANTEYNVIVIIKNSDSTLDVMFDTSVTGANVPSGYTAGRRIGSVFTDASSNIHAFRQVMDHFYYLDPLYVLGDTTGTLLTWQTTAALKVPANAVGLFYGQATVDNCTQPFLHIRHGDSAAAAGLANAVAMDAEAVSGFRAVGGTFEQQVDANKQIDYTINGAGATPATDWVQMDLVIRGYIDPRGKDE